MTRRRWPWPRRRKTFLLEGTRHVAAALVVARAHGWRLSGVHRVDGRVELVLEKKRGRRWRR